MAKIEFVGTIVAKATPKAFTSITLQTITLLEDVDVENYIGVQIRNTQINDFAKLGVGTKIRCTCFVVGKLQESKGEVGCYTNLNVAMFTVLEHVEPTPAELQAAATPAAPTGFATQPAPQQAVAHNPAPGFGAPVGVAASAPSMPQGFE
jgi:hypothetical protein